MKYYFRRLKSPYEITRFPLFQNVNTIFFRLKYEERALLFKYFCCMAEREDCRKLRECFKAATKKSMSPIRYRQHSLDRNNKEIVEEFFFIYF